MGLVDIVACLTFIVWIAKIISVAGGKIEQVRLCVDCRTRGEVAQFRSYGQYMPCGVMVTR